uniref:G-protein coupled receptors family 1 profile domain-containing protein n=1 Tax=Cyanistes caeruleus TaxID=156563 RepID=A0A8C0V9X6_CYACU
MWLVAQGGGSQSSTGHPHIPPAPSAGAGDLRLAPAGNPPLHTHSRCSLQLLSHTHRGEPGMNGSVLGSLLVEHPGKCMPNNPVQFVLVPVVYCLVLCVGLPGNLLALLVFLQSGKVRKAIRIYLINLTLADILFNLTLPLWIHYYLAGGDWLLSEAACRLAGAAYYLATYSAITFMALISFNRFCAVRAARRVLLLHPGLAAGAGLCRAHPGHSPDLPHPCRDHRLL